MVMELFWEHGFQACNLFQRTISSAGFHNTDAQFDYFLTNTRIRQNENLRSCRRYFHSEVEKSSRAWWALHGPKSWLHDFVSFIQRSSSTDAQERNSRWVTVVSVCDAVSASGADFGTETLVRFVQCRGKWRLFGGRLQLYCYCSKEAHNYNTTVRRKLIIITLLFIILLFEGNW